VPRGGEDHLVLARFQVDDREVVDRHGKPRRPGLTAQVDQPLRARRHHRHGQARVGEQQVIVEPADADDADLGGHRAAARKRPRSITTVPSGRAVWNRAAWDWAVLTSPVSQMDTVSDSPGSTGLLNRPYMNPNRAGSESHSACSSARPVTP
jgi:hypothetical protein